jgi:hypothetical protein
LDTPCTNYLVVEPARKKENNKPLDPRPT